MNPVSFVPTVTMSGLVEYIRTELESKQILAPLEDHIRLETSSAGKRPEEVFTREFLCPAIRKHFSVEARDQLDLLDEEIARGLGTEGFQNCEGFGFTPARKRKHLFTKGDIVKADPPVDSAAKNDVASPNKEA
ncbi:MAG: hypothetical protein HY695_17710 [Deltaproteobacteria bacterium]|nr:hypothetical protein [Deltaproteobacteria bacterium]